MSVPETKGYTGVTNSPLCLDFRYSSGVVVSITPLRRGSLYHVSICFFVYRYRIRRIFACRYRIELDFRSISDIHR